MDLYPASLVIGVWVGLAVIADGVEGSQKGTYHTQIGTFEFCCYEYPKNPRFGRRPFQ